MKQQRRWMKNVLVQSSQPLPAFPWARGARKAVVVARSAAPAPRALRA